MNEWKKQGLQEIGLTEQEYNNLSNEEKIEVDESLEELGH